MGNVQSPAILPRAFQSPGPGELLNLGRLFREPLALSRLHSTPTRVLSRREVVLLGIFALVLHGAVIVWVNQTPTPPLPVVPPEIPPMTIEFSQPAPPVVVPPPPEPIPQPVVEPPPPVEDELAVKPPPPKPIPKPKPVVKPAPKPVAKPVEQPPAPPAPPQPVAAPAPAAPPAPQPITPASANAGYLHNPAPEDRNNSLPTAVTQANASACNTPVAMLGRAAGSSTCRNRSQRLRTSTWPTSR